MEKESSPSLSYYLSVVSSMNGTSDGRYCRKREGQLVAKQ